MTETRDARVTRQGATLAGYAIRYGEETVIGDLFREVIAPGAATGSLSADVLALLDHDTGRVIGRTSSGTLRLSSDAVGLAVEIDLPDAPDGWSAAELVRRQDLAGMSFGFFVSKESWEDDGKNLPLRTVEQLELLEVSIVALPAYETTTIGIKAPPGDASQAAINASARARMQMQMAMRLRGIRA